MYDRQNLTQVTITLTLDQDTVFDTYNFAARAKVIDLSVPISGLYRALRSASNALVTELRLTKKDQQPLLAFRIVTSSWSSGRNTLGMAPAPVTTAIPSSIATGPSHPPGHDNNVLTHQPSTSQDGPRERETIIYQEIPVNLIEPSLLEDLHEPRSRPPDVNIVLPSLAQLKSISDRFTRLALETTRTTNKLSASSKLELSANGQGSLRLGVTTDALRISSVWTGLLNAKLQTQDGPAPDTYLEEDGWAKVRIDGRDWGKVLSIGRLSPRVIASFIHNTGLILYVFLPNSDETCLTVSRWCLVIPFFLISSPVLYKFFHDLKRMQRNSNDSLNQN